MTTASTSVAAATMTAREDRRHGESAHRGEEHQLFERRSEHGLPPFEGFHPP
jgi:hypothetical protein